MFSWVYLLYLKDSKCAKYRHQGTADWVTFIKEILMENLIFCAMTNATLIANFHNLLLKSDCYNKRIFYFKNWKNIGYSNFYTLSFRALLGHRKLGWPVLTEFSCHLERFFVFSRFKIDLKSIYFCLHNLSNKFDVFSILIRFYFRYFNNFR